MMAKTDWQMGDTVLPDDLNQIGQEINQNRDNLAAHTAATTGVHGATSAATPNTIVQRDGSGQFEVGAPTAANHVARKAEVDAAQGTANAAQSAINAHVARTDNPHFTTAAQVGAPSLTTTIPNGVSLNTVVTSGFYRLTDSHPDAPPSTGYGQMIVSRGGDTVFQIVTGFNHSHFYMRHGNPPEAGGQGVWQPWRRLWHDGNDGAGSGLDADLLDGNQLDVNATAWTVTQRAGDGSIRAAGIGFDIISPYGANHLGPGNGDDASYTTHNIKFRGWYGMGMYDHNNVCNGYYDFRAGKWDVKDGYYVNGVTVWHAGNFPYEAGNWTPELRFSGSTAGIAYASRLGRYTRIANVVYWSFEIVLSSKGSASGAAWITGLPFNKEAGLEFDHSVGRASNIALPSGQWLVSNISFATIYLNTNTGSSISDTAFANNSSLRASGFYFI